MKVAYLFPGQGAQYVGMGKDLYEAFPEARACFDRANEILGFDLKTLCFEGPEADLTSTVNSQPAILVTSIAALRAFEAWTAARTAHGDTLDEWVLSKPVATAGLSLGEYAALVAAGVLSFEDAVRLVRRRGELMDDASRRNPGTMCSVMNVPLDELREICRQTGAEIANLNAPGQVVLSGGRDAVQQAADRVKQAPKAKAVMLDVSGAFHSSLMAPAAQGLAEALNGVTFHPPQVPVVANVDASAHAEPNVIRENLVKQLTSSTRWEESMRHLVGLGVSHALEIGPGKVLRGLFRRIDAGVSVSGIENPDDLEKLIKTPTIS